MNDNLAWTSSSAIIARIVCGRRFEPYCCCGLRYEQLGRHLLLVVGKIQHVEHDLANGAKESRISRR